ncbi:MAG: rhodanese-like domain-containing protein [Epsilonproteobacteria bacterium]|nr:rhodanese-like domain-containing protein [Campylobacterota bacterium]
MFDFFTKGRKLKLGEEKRAPRADDFPTYELLDKITILDIRDEEEVEIYGKMPNSVHVPFDEYFASKLLMLDKNKKYGIMDLKGVDIKKALQIAKEAGIDAVELRGGFFYLSEVMNIKPIKEEK